MEELLNKLRDSLSDKYDVESKLGEGGMATVFLARDVRHERRVAIKLLHEDLGAALGVERFKREIEIATSLTHPHILPLYDSGEAADSLFYVMPFIEGESLRDLRCFRRTTRYFHQLVIRQHYDELHEYLS